MKGICRHTDCAELGEHNRDWTYGPLADFLFICDEHAELEDLKHTIECIRRTRDYHKSVVRNHTRDALKEMDQVDTLDEKIKHHQCLLNVLLKNKA